MCSFPNCTLRGFRTALIEDLVSENEQQKKRRVYLLQQQHQPVTEHRWTKKKGRSSGQQRQCSSSANVRPTWHRCRRRWRVTLPTRPPTRDSKFPARDLRPRRPRTHSYSGNVRHELTRRTWPSANRTRPKAFRGDHTARERVPKQQPPLRLTACALGSSETHHMATDLKIPAVKATRRRALLHLQ